MDLQAVHLLQQLQLHETAVTVAAPSPPAYISPTAVGVAALLIIFDAVVSVYLKLNMHYQLLTAATRCILQLSILGYILVPIFTYDRWYLVLAYAAFMLFVGCMEAIGRPGYRYKGMLLDVLGGLGAASAAFLSYGLLLVIHQRPWYEAQYFIPILGMLLGNAISGVGLGLTTLLEELSSGKDKVEMLLAIGATRWEAIREVMQRSVKVAITPILNQMNVAGLVTIPGLMTGQILSGLDPSQAARYQMIVMFMISATTAAAAVTTVAVAAMRVLDSRHRLRVDRLLPKPKSKGSLVTDRLNLWGRRLGARAKTAAAPLFRRNHGLAVDDTDPALVVSILDESPDRH